jgi:hypothetical protein
VARMTSHTTVGRTTNTRAAASRGRLVTTVPSPPIRGRPA